MNLNVPTIKPGPLTAENVVAASEAYPPADWPQMLAAAVAANLAHPAMSGADPLTECLAEQCACFARPMPAEACTELGCDDNRSPPADRLGLVLVLVTGAPFVALIVWTAMTLWSLR